MHVDGAFGLWAAACPELAGEVAGAAAADSWATDAHKWLNTTYDCGIALVRDGETLRAAMRAEASYLPLGTARDPMQFTPSSSQRARGAEVWAVLAALGRNGVSHLVASQVALARRFASGLSAGGLEVLNEVRLNQVVAACADARATEEMIAALQREGTCWCGPTTWRGRRAMRISLSNWTTTQADVDRSVAAVLTAAQQASAVVASAAIGGDPGYRRGCGGPWLGRRIGELDQSRAALLADAAGRAGRYLQRLADRAVAPSAEAVLALDELDFALPEAGLEPSRVLAALDEVGSAATVASAGPRYFGFVTGGALPIAVAASWLLSAWDQNAGLSVMSPVATRLDAVAIRWVCQLLGLPAGTSGGFVSGATMANAACLAAGRDAVLTRAGWDAAAVGLVGAPPIQVVVGDEVHAAALKALGLIGFGAAGPCGCAPTIKAGSCLVSCRT